MSIFNRNRWVVNPGETALEYRDGRLERVLNPGAHRVDARSTVVRVDTRERIVRVAPQEVLTADGVPVRVSLAIRLAVVDPVRYAERAEDPIDAVYVAAQIALRTACASVAVDDLVGRSDVVDGDALTAAAAAAGEPVGIAVRAVLIRDVILPHEIRAAAMELITAKSRGQAKLEAARAETAALRSLANAGRMLDQHPALARMRLVESVPYGTKVVLSVGDAADDVD
ncbi:slipin family protein [Gordonia sp. (in: high G+C Gram-positive bacteria)]|uniref:slipin family protein n=1 Tax=Gordonia sp. (in: high G+C Gram-positive bacteria) TaxID=84139 RepID=UPI0039E6313A